jgi:quercetin dioxygenase-like cupin family protein
VSGKDDEMASAKVQQWQLDDLKTEILKTLETGASTGDANLIDGRALAVKGSPLKASSSEIVVGTAALPPGFHTKPHSHAAEEIALVLEGRGVVEISGVPYPVGPGTLLLTPPNAPHVTHSDPQGPPLLILWFYAPPGSEQRWIPPTA